MLSAAAAAPAPGIAAARPPRTYSLEELAQRTDALALKVGAKATASTLLVACVVVILIGAQSLLATMEGMDRDLKEMNEQLAIANGGLVVLNDFMDSVEPTSRHLEAIVATVDDTSAEVKVSVGHIEAMTGTTAKLNEQLGAIAGSTTEMRTSLESAAGDTEELSTTIGELDTSIQPLVKTQHQMLLGTKKMRGGLDGMNASLAYVIRIMNYIAAPPTGQGMTIRAELPKQTLPPLPGIKAEVEPVPVFPRNIWPVYTGP
jgi:methyl-accepting chemotaxis protein